MSTTIGMAGRGVRRRQGPRASTLTSLDCLGTSLLFVTVPQGSFPPSVAYSRKGDMFLTEDI